VSGVLVRAPLVDAFTAGKGDFADHMILEHVCVADCNAMITFDRARLAEANFIGP
jgi:predicted nucleic-acid-binding protein